ncbi:hypothetical protein EV421DRAFT_2018738 [Armillaria borealis]|uniref:F-box domain-containing protein n=1 Tax=Armillaria borealis TaxID=47425 RepID=A0AA39MSL2_9AGAR|nr:hypothetical protein EV421DRAFT_2018738 [Armillaria borealis]
MANDVSDTRPCECAGNIKHCALCVSSLPSLDPDPSESSCQRPYVDLALAKSSLAPILHLPPEILIEIFLWASSRGSPLSIFDIKHDSWAITQVCRSWRFASTSMCPSIWSKIDINFDYNKLRGKRDPVSMLRSILLRSRQHVLNIKFHMSYREEEPFQSAMWGQLATHAERWLKIHVTLGHQEVSHLACLRGRLVQLEKCYVERHRKGPGPDLIDAFEYTPKLRSMTLIGLGPTTLVPVSCANLESFQDKREEWHAPDAIHTHFINLLCRSPKLTVFRALYRCDRGSLADVISPRVSKPAITYFAGCEETLLRSLSLPQLKQAVLSQSAADCLGDFHDLLLHSQCHALAKLSINDVRLSESLLPILRLSPVLLSLDISARDWFISDDDSVQSLFRHLLESPELVPRLESITFDLSLFDELDKVYFFNHVMVEMIEVRRASSLRTFQVTSTFTKSDVDTFCDWTDDDLRQLYKIKAEGFNVGIVAYLYYDREERRIYV